MSTSWNSSLEGNWTSSVASTTLEQYLGGSQWVDLETAQAINRVFLYGIQPLISFTGMIGNLLSIVLFTKLGLNKSSNILTVALAGICFFYLLYVTVSNFRYIFNVQWYQPFHGYYLYDHSKIVAYLYFIIDLLEVLVFFVTSGMLFGIPMLITIERLIAVFLPLRFMRIVTPPRTWCSVVALGLYCLSQVLNYYSTRKFEYGLFLNTSVLGVESTGRVTSSNIQFILTAEVIEKCFPAITFVGCMFIIWKVKLATRKRQNLTTTGGKTHQKPAVSKTTRTLLLVCISYIVVYGLCNVVYRYYLGQMRNEQPLMVGLLLPEIVQTIYCLNCTCNFFIYMASNDKFRASFVEMTRKRLCYSKSK